MYNDCIYCVSESLSISGFSLVTKLYHWSGGYCFVLNNQIVDLVHSLKFFKWHVLLLRQRSEDIFLLLTIYVTWQLVFVNDVRVQMQFFFVVELVLSIRNFKARLSGLMMWWVVVFFSSHWTINLFLLCVCLGNVTHTFMEQFLDLIVWFYMIALSYSIIVGIVVSLLDLSETLLLFFFLVRLNPVSWLRGLVGDYLSASGRMYFCVIHLCWLSHARA